MAKSGCKSCEGRGHVLREDGAWARCRCIRQRITQVEYRRSGVPEVHWLTSARDLRETIGPALTRGVDDLVASTLSGRGRLAPMAWARVRAIGAVRPALVAYAIRLAIVKGRSAHRAAVSELIDDQFAEGESRGSLMAAVKSAWFAVVELDVRSEHKLLPQIVARVIESRTQSGRATLFVSSDDVGAMPGRYGPDVSAAFARGGTVRRIVGGGGRGG